MIPPTTQMEKPRPECSQAAQGVPGTADVRSLGVGSRAELGLERDSRVPVQAWGPASRNLTHWETRKWDFSKIHAPVVSQEVRWFCSLVKPK